MRFFANATTVAVLVGLFSVPAYSLQGPVSCKVVAIYVNTNGNTGVVFDTEPSQMYWIRGDASGNQYGADQLLALAYQLLENKRTVTDTEYQTWAGVGRELIWFEAQ